MLLKRGKVFIKYVHNSTKFTIRPYSFSVKSYYNYLKIQNKNGYDQIPLTSEILISIMRKLSTQFNFLLSKDQGIGFMEDDSDFKSEINEFINSDSQKKNRKFILHKLSVLDTHNSIEITHIKLVNNSSIVYIQNNGIVYADKLSYNKIIPIILGILNDN